jgi:hypothetical protein
VTIDEAEGIARSYAHLTDPADPYPAELVGDLSRFIIDVLPVVRAAEAYQHAERHEDGDASWRAESALFQAIDALRSTHPDGKGGG